MFQLLLFLSLLATPPSKEAIASVERSFYTNIKQIDKEQHRNLTAQFKKIFQRNHSSPYQLYTELLQIKEKSRLEALEQARKLGFKDREYSRFVGDIESNYVMVLMNRYRMSIDQRNAFRSNYCSCYVGSTANYCNGGTCVLGKNL